jgi:predicted phage terminase large subunit-like protein
MNLETTSVEQLRSLALACRTLEKKEKAEHLEASFIDFVREAWPAIDSAPYQQCWAIDALAEHLQAIVEGKIRKLLVNYPPRCAKTNVTSISLPAFIWAQSEISFLKGPQVRFLAGSYNHDLSLTNSNMTRRLILSPWYQSLWGHRFKFREDQNTKTKFDTSAGGSRLATSVGSSLLGIGGEYVIIDDPHNVEGAESEAERRTAQNWWKEISTTRLNDPKRSPLIVVMQRLHEIDVSGVILSSERSDDWVHLMIPMEYESRRHCVTVLGWQDPRGLDDDGEPLLERGDGGLVPRDGQAAEILEEREGTLMWPERFGPREIERIKAELGPYMASGRLQQSPTPKGGGLIKRDWVEVWAPADNMFPILTHVVASVDPAFTEKQSNDPSAMTVWGVFTHPVLQKTRVILVDAWRKHLQLHGRPTPRLEHEIVRVGDTRQVVRQKAAMWERRVGNEWGLVEWVSNTCCKFSVGKLLIENKASGISAAQELQRLYGREGWETWLQDPKGLDKFSRLLSCQSIFSQGLVYAPDRAYADMWLTELCLFPHGRYDDLVDASSMALSYLRNVGVLRFDDEVQADIEEGARHRPLRRRGSLYPC